ncbi:heavy metal-associated isoprenylated plant protein 47 [Setaria italica]|uniref:HMA domain-containing protein n=2 Tax=Setaria italica TaxID=4555 RepID=K3ZLG1_SETIT|nr:heavy metal-associated isoprenylated plant protein 47 [Setaria italica]XP_022685154.1 heavy metal-associated isoprenylated plant protein 47 [Setaria italica]
MITLPIPATELSTSSVAQNYAYQSPHRAWHFGSEPCSATPPEESATMKKKIVIRVEMTCDRRRAKAVALVAATPGVSSVAVAGDATDQLVVIGDGFDSIRLASALRREVGPAEIVQVAAEAKECGCDKKPPTAAAAVPLPPYVPRARSCQYPPQQQPLSFVYEPPAARFCFIM